MERTAPVIWGVFIGIAQNTQRQTKKNELLAKNFARIRNQLKITNDLLDKYKQYYEPEKKKDVKDGE